VRNNNSWLHNSPRLAKGPDRCTAMIHPDDAAARGIATGDQVRVSSRVGAVQLAAEVSEDVMPGVISIPHGFGQDKPGTRLSVAAARALGASDEDLAPFAVERARPSDPAEWLAQADDAHRRALALLGRLRATHPVGPEIVASLVEAAREHTLVPTSTPEGLVLSDPSDRALLDLARAFPHGLVVLRGRGAAARQRRLARELPDRFGVDESDADPAVVFTAYTTAPQSTSVPTSVPTDVPASSPAAQ